MFNILLSCLKASAFSPSPQFSDLRYGFLAFFSSMLGLDFMVILLITVLIEAATATTAISKITSKSKPNWWVAIHVTKHHLSAPATFAAVTIGSCIGTFSAFTSLCHFLLGSSHLLRLSYVEMTKLLVEDVLELRPRLYDWS